MPSLPHQLAPLGVPVAVESRQLEAEVLQDGAKKETVIIGTSGHCEQSRHLVLRQVDVGLEGLGESRVAVVLHHGGAELAQDLPGPAAEIGQGLYYHCLNI